MFIVNFLITHDANDMFYLFPGPTIVVARAGGGGGSARAPRALGVRRAAGRARPAPQEDAARAPPPVAAVPLFTGNLLCTATEHYNSRYHYITVLCYLRCWVKSNEVDTNDNQQRKTYTGSDPIKI